MSKTKEVQQQMMAAMKANDAERKAALSLLLYGAGFSRERGRSLLMALSLGVLWQVVTLTSFGARLVAAIDHIFCSEKREVKS